MTIVEFFDPRNADHCRAFQHLEQHGCWPDGFIPDDVEMTSAWQVALYARLAGCWIDHVVAVDNTRRRRDEMRQKLEDERKSKIRNKPKKDEILRLMREGWTLCSHPGVRGSKLHYWLRQDGDHKSVHAGSVKALLRAKLIRVKEAGGMASRTTYELTGEQVR